MLKRTLFSFVLMTSGAIAQEIEIETYTGSETVVQNPQNVAVFDLAALDTLLALKVSPAGTVSNVYLSYLEKGLADFEPVGTIFEPDFEAVHALHPDLVIAGGRSSDQVNKLARLAPTVNMTIWEDPVTQGLQRLTDYGRIFGKEAEAQALQRAFDDKLLELETITKDQGRVLIVMTNGPKVSAYGPKGRFGWIYRILNLPEAVETVEEVTHGEAISFEFIRDVNPDVLLVIDRLAAIGQSGAAARSTLDNALVHKTNAWKNNKVIHLNAGPIYIAAGGIQSLNMTVDQLITAFSES